MDKYVKKAKRKNQATKPTLADATAGVQEESVDAARADLNAKMHSFNKNAVAAVQRESIDTNTTAIQENVNDTNATIREESVDTEESAITMTDFVDFPSIMNVPN